MPDITEARRQRGGSSGRPGLPIKEDETNGLHRHEERRRKASGKWFCFIRLLIACIGRTKKIDWNVKIFTLLLT